MQHPVLFADHSNHYIYWSVNLEQHLVGMLHFAGVAELTPAKLSIYNHGREDCTTVVNAMSLVIIIQHFADQSPVL